MKKVNSSRKTSEWLNVKMTNLRELIRRDMRRIDIMHNHDPVDMENRWQDCLKKFCNPVTGPDLDDKAFKLFHQVNDRLSKVVFDKPTLGRFSKLSHSKEQNILLAAKRWCHVILKDLTTEEWFSSCKNSGGSSIGVPYTDTSPERKFMGPISTTKQAKSIYLSALSHNPRLWDAVMIHNGLDMSVRTDKSKMFDIVDASRATTVPKSTDISRMIAIEPTANMYLQQGLMTVMYDRLRKFGLDVKTLPTRHQYLARKGSISGKLSTIDFSSASDCLSIKLVEYLLPDKWMTAISSVRCDKMIINDQPVNLSMISTMGNATTFPLETVVFYCLAMGCISVSDNSCLPDESIRSSVSVFGDDCIVPSYISDDFISICEYVGFTINKEKSFYDGKPGFRESCGGDFLHGIDVRPLYFKWPSSLKGSGIRAYFYNIYNNLKTKYILYFGDCRYFYMSALRYLRDLLATDLGQLLLVPPYMPSDSGIHGDDARIIKYYKGPLGSLWNNKFPSNTHGCRKFHYLRFVYFSKRDTDPGIRLQLWFQRHNHRCIRSPLLSLLLKEEKGEDPFYSLRSRGSYVVAKSQSVHWTPGE